MRFYKTFSDRATKPIFFNESSDGSTIYACIVYPKEREELLQAINYMKVLENDWNGFGARKPLTLVIEIVDQFIKNIPLNKIYPTQLSPDGEGGVTLKWTTVDTKLLLNFEPGLINLAMKSKNKKPKLIDGIVYNGENIIPQKLLTYIPEHAPNKYNGAHCNIKITTIDGSSPKKSAKIIAVDNLRGSFSELIKVPIK